ncbi:MAG: hypothetical protein WAN04_15410 [Candidatus Udaeobacter sp.]
MRRRIALPTPKLFAKPRFPHTAGGQCENLAARALSAPRCSRSPGIIDPGYNFQLSTTSLSGLTDEAVVSAAVAVSD